ncbi:MAG: BlaI/MecI/CopY family transcriptional regulator [Pirellulales bacterium]|nr:BlaI/MecI/CopY family transcriptional regulator [Pirellulales bacterium]
MGDRQPTERELEALKVLWDRGEATVREICEATNQHNADLAYTTVLSLLQVMEQKGLASHRRDGKAYVYSAEIELAKTFRQMAGEFLDRVFDGAVGEYVVHALESRKLSPRELDELQAMIDEAKQDAAGKRAGSRRRKRRGEVTVLRRRRWQMQ